MSPYSVSLEWIVESMKRGQKVSESSYPFPPTEIKVRFVFFHLPGTDLDNALDPFHFDVSLSKSVLVISGSDPAHECFYNISLVST